MMKFQNVEVCDAYTCETAQYYDTRGYFTELFSQKDLSKFAHFEVAQINCSYSVRGVLRGLHVVPFGKLVYCVKGKIFDVVADVRKKSPTYLKWFGIELTGENQKSLFIPPHCGHGFMALEDSIVIYAQNAVHNPDLESSVYYADPKLNIQWPLPILSEKDRRAPLI